MVLSAPVMMLLALLRISVVIVGCFDRWQSSGALVVFACSSLFCWCGVVGSALSTFDSPASTSAVHPAN